jgi:hypothetical protein
LSSLVGIAAVCIGAVVLLDVIVSFASKYLGVPYTLASVGSFLIYGITGYFVGRISSPLEAALVGAIVGLSESTVGWYLSWVIGPGRPATGPLGRSQIATAIVTVTIIGGVLAGAVAALAASFRAS